MSRLWPFDPFRILFNLKNLPFYEFFLIRKPFSFRVRMIE
jgi:hypothetical protein